MARRAITDATMASGVSTAAVPHDRLSIIGPHALSRFLT